MEFERQQWQCRTGNDDLTTFPHHIHTLIVHGWMWNWNGFHCVLRAHIQHRTLHFLSGVGSQCLVVKVVECRGEWRGLCSPDEFCMPLSCDPPVGPVTVTAQDDSNSDAPTSAGLTCQQWAAGSLIGMMLSSFFVFVQSHCKHNEACAATLSFSLGSQDNKCVTCLFDSEKLDRKALIDLVTNDTQNSRRAPCIQKDLKLCPACREEAASATCSAVFLLHTPLDNW